MVHKTRYGTYLKKVQFRYQIRVVFCPFSEIGTVSSFLLSDSVVEPEPESQEPNFSPKRNRNWNAFRTRIQFRKPDLDSDAT